MCYYDNIVLLLDFFERYDGHQDLHVLTHSFPTRRSSDLHGAERNAANSGRHMAPERERGNAGCLRSYRAREGRPEDHTYELQSIMRSSYAVFSLKKKNRIYQSIYNKSSTNGDRYSYVIKLQTI